MRYLEQREEFLNGLANTKTVTEDRVSITLNEYLYILDEYTHMKDEVDRLEGVIRETNRLFAAMGIPVEVIERIVPESVEMTVCENTMDFSREYATKFKVHNYR